MADTPKYWFPAKRYGWGWSFPRTWQGSLVIGVYAALVGAGIIVVPASTRPTAFIAYMVLLTILLVGVCWLKGEPLRSRGAKRNGA
jgi:hypothetical protein